MNDVEEVKNKTDIVSIIGEHVRLTKAGRNFKGLCPFHEERSPSFMVSPELQMYKCFGCGEAGDVFNFLQKYEGMDFPEALQFLSDKAGVTLTKRVSGEASLKQQVIEVNRVAAQFYHYLLKNHALGKESAMYIKEKRGLEDKTIDTFSIGAAPKNPSILFNFLVRKKKFKPDIIEQAGLVYKTQRGYMDRFRERVIFPISNHRGEVIALAGRILPQYDTGKVGKYINSPETPAYHKSSSLYGLNVTKDEIRKSRTAVVVEGELDLLSLWQAGIKNVVAIKGTAMTEDHVRILSRFAETLIMALDSDFAGDSASLRGLSFAQNNGLEVRVMSLGEYKDPDEFAKADPTGLLKAIKNSIDAWEFVIGVVSKRFDLSTGAGKAKASKQLVPVLSTIEDAIVRSHYLQKAATRLGVPVEAVNQEVSKQDIPKKMEEAIIPANKTHKNRRELLEERLLVLSTYDAPPKGIDGLFTARTTSKVYAAMKEYIKEHPSFESKSFVKSLPDELRKWFSDLIISTSAEDIKDPAGEMKAVLRDLTELTLKEKLSQVAHKISEYERQGNNEKVSEFEQEFQQISGKLSKLRNN